MTTAAKLFVIFFPFLRRAKGLRRDPRGTASPRLRYRIGSKYGEFHDLFAHQPRLRGWRRDPREIYPRRPERVPAAQMEGSAERREKLRAGGRGPGRAPRHLSPLGGL